MARLPYLVRQALGRSAYEPAIKPQPVDEAAKAREAALIQAKNEVLLTVGVTERSTREPQIDASIETLERLRAVQHLSRNFSILYLVGTQWITSIRARLLAGEISSAPPFAAIVANEWASFRSFGFPGMTSFLLAGLSDTILLRMVLARYVELEDDSEDGGGDFRRHERSLLSRFRRSPVVYSIGLAQFGISTAVKLLQLNDLRSSWTTLRVILPWPQLLPMRWMLVSRPTLLPSKSSIMEVLVSPLSLGLVAIHLQLAWMQTWASCSHHSNNQIETPFKHDMGVPYLQNGKNAEGLFSPLLRRLARLTGWTDPTEDEKALQGPASGWTVVPAVYLGYISQNLLFHALETPLSLLFYRVVAITFRSRAQGLDTAASVSSTLLASLHNERWGSLLSKVGLCLAVEASISAVVWGGLFWSTKRAHAREVALARERDLAKRGGPSGATDD